MERHRYLLTAVLFIAALVLLASCKKDEDTPNGPPSGPTPITDDLFPTIAGHQYVYVGYGITTGGAQIPDPTKVYRTVWTIGPTVPSPTGGTATAIIDTTTLQTQAGVFGKRTTLLVRKDSATGDVQFLQTIGPFFRFFNIQRTDTLRWVMVAKPSVGLGGIWTALDSVYTSASGSSVRLQILGKMEGVVDITDSSAAHAVHQVYKTRTYRNVWVNNASAVSNATTSEIWLKKDAGPIQVHIAQDTENIGHFRVLFFKNF